MEKDTDKKKISEKHQAYAYLCTLYIDVTLINNLRIVLNTSLIP